MIKILIVSDTHGDIGALKKIVKREKNCDIVIHLGDHHIDMEEVEALTKSMDVYTVRGNCDFGGAEDEQLIEINGVRIFFTHGHFYGVKYTLQNLLYKAEELEADIALFGHTHERLDTEFYGIRLFNPGTLSRRTYGDSGYGILSITDMGTFRFEHKHI